MFFLDSQIRISFAFLNDQFSFTNVISQKKLDTIGSAFTLSLEDKYIIKLTDILSSTLLKPYEGKYIETINRSVSLATVNFRTVGGG